MIVINFTPSSTSKLPREREREREREGGGRRGGGRRGRGLIFINDFKIIVKPMATALMTVP